jgi:hypothetical protein
MRAAIREDHRIFRRNPPANRPALHRGIMDRARISGPVAGNSSGRRSNSESRYLRVILLADGQSVHNAFFDRRFVP